jgi:hypothetical protein
MMKFNSNLYPKDGYVYKNPDGAILRSTKGWTDLIARVKDYRRINKHEPGNPEAEVHAQACANYPAYCSDSSRVVAPVATTRRSLKGIILQWLAEVRRKKADLKFVREGEVNARTIICALCPRNVALPDGCAPCKAAVREAREDILARKKITHSLNACDALQADCAVLVHLDTPALDRPELPNHCWMKRK